MKIERPSLYWQQAREWPREVPDAPEELVSLIEDAMVDFGPDRHCDGAAEIAALALQWMRDWQKTEPK